MIIISLNTSSLFHPSAFPPSYLAVLSQTLGVFQGSVKGTSIISTSRISSSPIPLNTFYLFLIQNFKFLVKFWSFKLQNSIYDGRQRPIFNLKYPKWESWILLPNLSHFYSRLMASTFTNLVSFQASGWSLISSLSLILCNQTFIKSCQYLNKSMP